MAEIKDYPSNSNVKKEERRKEAVTERRANKVVTGGAKTQKKSDIRKFTDIFLAEDISTVKSYILMDVLVPAVKKAIDDIVSNGIHMLLYKETDRNRGSNRPAARVSYGSYYNDNRSRDRERVSSRRNDFDYENIVFDRRGDAETVLTALEDIIDQYSYARVADLYELAGVTTDNYMVNRYGWADLHNAVVTSGRDGYYIRFPKALPLD